MKARFMCTSTEPEETRQGMILPAYHPSPSTSRLNCLPCFSSPHSLGTGTYSMASIPLSYSTIFSPSWISIPLRWALLPQYPADLTSSMKPWRDPALTAKGGALRQVLASCVHWPAPHRCCLGHKLLPLLCWMVPIKMAQKKKQCLTWAYQLRWLKVQKQMLCLTWAYQPLDWTRCYLIQHSSCFLKERVFIKKREKQWTFCNLGAAWF